MSLVPGSAWTKYKKLIGVDAHESFNQDVITWIKGRNVIMSNAEEEDSNGAQTDLKCLINYNVFRTWPLTRKENTGESDNQNMVAIFSKNYLSSLNLLNQRGYFDFRPDRDYFVHKGIRYKAEGDTLAAQAQDDPLLFYLVLHREEILTGDKSFDFPLAQAVVFEAEETQLYLVSHDILSN